MVHHRSLDSLATKHAITTSPQTAQNAASDEIIGTLNSLLAIGYWLLAIGYWLLAIGY